jgi:RimJ/RimL family protein N-acetyltransferase
MRRQGLADFKGDELPTITTARLRLRWLTEADIPALLTIFGDREVMRYWSHGPLADLDAAGDYLRTIHEDFAARELFQWGVELLAAGRVIGTCTLAQLNAGHQRAEIGFALARAHWGCGYMSECLTALLRFAFESLRLHRLTADADPRNHASIRLLERMGFRREGYLHEHYFVHGERQDALLMGLLRSHWVRPESGP